MAQNPLVAPQYLGDGVYASFDGYHIVLDLRGQASPHTCTISLEPAVLNRLDQFRQAIDAARARQAADSAIEQDDRRQDFEAGGPSQ